MRKELVGLAKEAGQLLLEDFQKPDLKVITKPDGSPVTEADLRVSDFFLERLASYGLPVVTEEAVPDVVPVGEYFIIDPLDGTWYFMNGEKHFAVLVGLVKDRRPIAGVVHFPVLDMTFSAEKGLGAELNGEIIRNQRSSPDLIAFSTGFHKKDVAKPFMEQMNIREIKEQLSVIKMGYLARGDADLYPRFGRTYEWDTAAAQIVVEESGLTMWDVNTMEPLLYGKKNFKNTGYIVFRNDLEEKLTQALGGLKWPMPKESKR